MSQIQPAFSSEQQLATDGGHRIVQIHARSFGGGGLRSHKPRGSPANNRNSHVVRPRLHFTIAIGQK